MILRQAGKEFPRVAVLRLIRAIQTNDDPVQVFHLGQFIQNIRQGVALKLGKQ